MGTPTLSPGWKIANGYLIGPGVNLANANLSNQDLSGVNLGNANLSNTNLSGANLNFVSSGGLTGVPSAMPTNYSVIAPNSAASGWTSSGGYLVGPNVAIVGATMASYNLSGYNLSGASFVYTNLQSANLSNANLTGAYFDTSTYMPYSSFNGANLYGAFLGFRDYSSGVNFSNANCSYANFSGSFIQAPFTNTNLTSATIWYSNLGFGDFSTATLTGNNSGGNWGSGYKLPSGWKLSNGVITK